MRTMSKRARSTHVRACVATPPVLPDGQAAASPPSLLWAGRRRWARQSRRRPPGNISTTASSYLSSLDTCLQSRDAWYHNPLRCCGSALLPLFHRFHFLPQPLCANT